MLDQDAEHFAHVHGALPVVAASAEDSGHGEHGGHGELPASFGPTIVAAHTFVQAGVYKVWVEFQTGAGEPLVADFVVNVQ
jgi:hypothetical protein